MPGSPLLHFGRLKIRVVGTGVLRCSLIGYDGIKTSTIAPITMSSTTYKQEMKLTNFLSERAKVRIETTGINEVMRVNSLIVFVRSIYSEYPQ